MSSDRLGKTTSVTPRAHELVAPGVAADDANVPTRDTGRWTARRPLVVAIAIFIAVFVLFAVGLNLDPRKIPSPLIGKPVPEFSLPPVKGRTLGLSTADIRGEVSLVNVFASWCVACRDEHPLLMQLSRQGIVPIHGLNY